MEGFMDIRADWAGRYARPAAAAAARSRSWRSARSWASS